MSIEIRFTPDDRKISFAHPVSLTEAAEAAGLHLRGSCGGKSLCGKCKDP